MVIAQLKSVTTLQGAEVHSPGQPPCGGECIKAKCALQGQKY